jgi:hypothetical protein
MTVNIQNSKLNIRLTEECIVGLFKLSINTIYKSELWHILQYIHPQKADHIIENLPEMFTGLDLIS